MSHILEFSIQDINQAAPDLKQVIETQYDLGAVIEVAVCEMGDTNRNFRILCEKNGEQTWYFAKLFGIYKTLERLELECELYHYFAQRAQGRMECPLPIPSSKGELVFRGVCKAAGITSFFVVFGFLGGRSVDENAWRCIMRDGYLKGFAQGLASFHDFSWGFTPSFTPSEREDLMDDINRWEAVINRVEELRGNMRTVDYYSFFRPKVREVLDMLRHNRDLLKSRLKDLPVCVTHGDCSPNNYMYQGDEELTACGVCDFDWAKERPRIFDVCWMMCEVLSLFDPESGETTFETERMCQFVRDYNQRIERSEDFGPGKLRKEELSIVPEMMELIMIQMTIHDRFGYMLENNQRVGGSEENIGVTFWGLSIIQGIENQKEEIRSALLNMKE